MFAAGVLFLLFFGFVVLLVRSREWSLCEVMPVQKNVYWVATVDEMTVHSTEVKCLLARSHTLATWAQSATLSITIQ